GILNERGLRSYEGKPFHRLRVRDIRRAHGLVDLFTRLRAAGMLTPTEMAARLQVCRATVQVWRRHGLLAAHAYTDKGECLCQPPTDQPPMKGKWKFTPRRTPHP